MDEEHVDRRRVQPPAIATAVSRGRARSDLGPESAHVMETRRGRVGRPHALSLLTTTMTAEDATTAARVRQLRLHPRTALVGLKKLS